MRFYLAVYEYAAVHKWEILQKFRLILINISGYFLSETFSIISIMYLFLHYFENFVISSCAYMRVIKLLDTFQSVQLKIRSFYIMKYRFIVTNSSALTWFGISIYLYIRWEHQVDLFILIELWCPGIIACLLVNFVVFDKNTVF